MPTISKRGAHQFQVKVRKKGYPTQTKTFESRSAAEMWARAIESEMDVGRFIGAGRRESESTSLGEALARYANEVTPTKRGAQVELCRIAAFRDRRLREGYAPSTVQKDLILIQHLFKIAQREWGMEALRNPLESVRKPTADNARTRVFLPEEEARLLETLTPQVRTKTGKYSGGTGNAWIQYLVRLAIETAMRRGELLELSWEHIDLEHAIAHLPITKNGTARTAPSPLPQ